MKARLALIIAAGCGLVGMGVRSNAATPLGSSASRPVEAGTKIIYLGTSSDEVRRMLGRPASIRPMASPAGAAEVWEYRRPLGTQVRQLQTGKQTLATGINGMGSDAHFIDVPVYQNEYTQTEEVTQLLFLDGKLISSKRTTVSHKTVH